MKVYVVRHGDAAGVAGGERVVWFLSGDGTEYTLPGFPEAAAVALDMEFVGRGQATLDWFAFAPYFERCKS